MKINIIWESAIKAVRKNRRRSLLTMLGLIIGIASVITIVSVGRGYKQAQMRELLPTSDDQTTQVTLKFTPEESSFKDTNFINFSQEDMQLLESVYGVKHVVRSKENPEKSYRKKEVSFRGTDETMQIQLIHSLKQKQSLASLKHSRTFNDSDLINQNKVVYVSSQILAEASENNQQSLIGEVIKIQDEDFLVVGVFPSTSYSSLKIQMPAQTYAKYFPGEEVTNMDVTFTNEISSVKMLDTLTRTMNSKGSNKDFGKYQPVSDGGMVDTLGELFSSMTAMFTFVGAISLFVSGVGVMNMIYTSISERTKEIGIRRALGATERSIQLQFLFEGLTITLVAGGIGYVAGLFIAKFISMILNFNFIPDFFTAFIAVLLSVTVGLIFSYYPSKSATEKDVVELVR
ncbi:ABC transporter permease [Enterococcus sp. LJL128]|uniref:ABC transporter permease n=1 Tax=Enterococcus sp. LJL51 TaxID=3416656 RepID=UPI003CEBAF50